MIAYQVEIHIGERILAISHAHEHGVSVGVLIESTGRSVRIKSLSSNEKIEAAYASANNTVRH
jgi:hypothetical protein